ncbi:MAG: 1-acyl-sn-glycerol-3-phosphate acyltransferase, partial [Oscillospiraceae bacterium]|nr:1-acyl-sn-glycerol-3-phosphate acyltransferase [Oscillospiraceae bacterium]
MVYAICFWAVMVAFRVIFSYRAYDKEILRAYKTNGRKFVICANHLSMLDPIFIVMAYGWGRKLTIMGKAELFRNPVFAWIFRSVGVFPVERGKADTAALDKAIADINTGRGMLIFPEGTRGTGDTMAKMKSGAFMIAAQTGADIIPVRVIYPTSTRLLKFFAPVVVKVGRPLLAEDMNLVEGGKRAIRAARNTLQESLDTL